MMKILFHICCAPCLIAPYAYFRQETEHTLTGFWYNPNIHPYQEYKRRKDTLAAFAQAQNLPIIWRDDYALEEFLRSVVYREANRCGTCYEMRLRATAERAKRDGYEAFSSTLLYSKYQNHELIRSIAEALAIEYQISFYYEDLRRFWKQGIELSKTEGMYRQPYCGCIYSEKDRYLPQKGTK